MSKELTLIPSPEELNIYQVMAKNASQSKFFNNLGGEGGILSIMLMARELGIRPMEALMGGINIIMGKAEISPRLMNTLIRKAGHKIEILESTNEICTLRGVRHDTGEQYLVSFSIQDSKTAGLYKAGGGWEKYPSDMLFARCMSRLARRLFADVISSSYVEGELSDSEYVDKADRVQPSGNSVQLHGNAVQLEKPEPLVEEAVVKDNFITLEDFLSKIRVHAGDDLSLGYMEPYLAKMSLDRHMKTAEIMLYALKPELTSRFLNGYKSWMNAQLETESITDEAMRK